MKYPNLYFKQITYSFGAFISAVTLLLAGCDNNNTSVEDPEPRITDALIQLDGDGDEAAIEVGETVKFNGFALTETGDRIPLAELGENWSWTWESTDPSVFIVDDEGHAVGEKEGEAYCVITLNGPDDGTENNLSKQGASFKTASNPAFPETSGIFVGRDSLFVIFLN